MDTIVGTAAPDFINTTETTGVVEALGGNDYISVWTSNGGAQSINAGDGDDFIEIQLPHSAAPTDITLTLGAGRDTVKIFEIQRPVTVTDFKTGAQGDAVDFRYTLDQWVNGWDGHTNPFKAGSPYFRLVQVGANTVLQIDKHDWGVAGTWTDWMVFQNTSVQDFTAENFGGVAPDGSAPPNLVLQGTANGDLLDGGYGNDRLYGGEGNDDLNGGPGDDLLDGGPGLDFLREEAGGNDRLLGGAGDDTLQVSSYSTANGPNGRAAYMDGGEGNDNLSYGARANTNAVFTGLGGAGDDLISAMGAVTTTIDAGAGSDRVFFSGSGASTITLGEGRDIAVAYIPEIQEYSAGTHVVHITDFQAGLAGDRLDISSYVKFIGWTGQADLLPSKYLRFEQVGADTVISIDPYGGGRVNATVVLDNVQLSSLTAFNLTGLHPSGAFDGVVGVVNSGAFTGTDGGDLLISFYGGVTLNGGNGGDRLEGNSEQNTLSGDEGDDILIGAGSLDYLFGGAGADLLDGGSGWDRLDGGSGGDILQGGAGADRLAGGTGADLFEGTLADLAGDTIVDLEIGDVIKITDADPTRFSFVRTGSTVTFSTGESLILSNNPHNELVVLAGASGGVQLALSATSKAVTAAPSFNADFDGDGLSDLAWREEGGTFTTWRAGLDHDHLRMNSNVFVAEVEDNWKLAAADDFDGDGKSDLMWRNVDGLFSVWTSTGSGFAANTLVDGSVSPDWGLAATGDFNGDRKADLIWRHANGTFTEWNSTGSGFQQNVYVQGGVDSSWRLAGVGDFDGDGRDDMVWRNTGGVFTLWASTGAGFTPNVLVDGTVSADWNLAAVGDFNGDGKSDLLWRHTDGAFSEWRSIGAGFEKNVYVNGQVGVDWSLESVGDFNGDGKADLMWRHEGGMFTIWTSTVDGFALNTLVDGSVSPNWALASADYFMV